MRFFLLLFFLPLYLSAQQLPDTATAAKAGVKKLVILRLEEGQPDDTQAVYFFDKGWKDRNGFPPGGKPASDSLLNTVRDADGRIIFSGPKSLKHKCYNDTIGTSFQYDEQGRLIHTKSFSCEKGDLNTWFRYDSAGNKILEFTDVRGDRMDSRIEYRYNASGQVISQTNWWAADPQNTKRDSSDYLAAEIEYRYDAGGLIASAKVNDVMHYLYIPLFDWKTPDQEPRPFSSSVTFRYIYIY